MELGEINAVKTGLGLIGIGTVFSVASYICYLFLSNML